MAYRSSLASCSFRYSHNHPIKTHSAHGNGARNRHAFGGTGLYYAQGRYGEAGPLLKRALEGQERVLGQDPPNTLTSVNN